MSLEIICAEFGPRKNNNNLEFRMPRLDPTYTNVKNYFPDAKITLYTDRPEIANDYPDVNLHLVDVEKDTPFSKNHPYWGWFCCDYF